MGISGQYWRTGQFAGDACPDAFIALTLANKTKHFIRKRIENDLRSGRCARPVTRFPPEPNGLLHLGHAKAALLSHGMAREYGGAFFLRMDDTNPLRESKVYTDAIQQDLRWLGCEWDGPVRYTSDYFEQLYDYATQLVRLGLAYVCDLDSELMRQQRGTLLSPGTPSPGRERTVEDNLQRFADMRGARYDDGACVLRARIDMAAANLNMRDPVLYRIRRARHHRTADKWCIYPTYDFSHCLCDAIEGITHSLCTLEFEDHRPLYEWLLNALEVQDMPQQIEFARLNLEGTVMSKRKLQELIDAGVVHDWDDPRLPTLSALRRRGCPPLAIHDFCERIGVAKADNTVGLAQLDHSVRSHLETRAPRAMCVLRPLRVVISNWEAGRTEQLELPSGPGAGDAPPRRIDFAGELYIEQDDYSDDPPPGYRRLRLGSSVRLRGAWVIRCDAVERDAHGAPTLLRCSYDPETLGVKPKYAIGGVIHWVSLSDATRLTVRLYEPLFAVARPGDAEQLADVLEPGSEQVLEGCYAEPGVRDLKVGEVRQFERRGYFCMDGDSSDAHPVFNRVVSLRSTWQPSPAS